MPEMYFLNQKLKNITFLIVLPIHSFYYVTVIFLRQFFFNCHIIFPHHKFYWDTLKSSPLWIIIWQFTASSVKGYQPPPPSLFEPSPLITRIPPFLKISHLPTLPANRSFQVFLINRNATKKLSSINTIHVKQQNNVGFFIFKFHSKVDASNIYINKSYARQCLYIRCIYYMEGFSHPFSFFVVSKGTLNV